ncbi:two-component response regulator ORR41-like [Herrania umbratica]|uniref:Two-component response regulator ORR41-like n=1 Tax=Herrania umbratica TaxID=108875 RepID=A0A6J1BRD6_9ROSI|nr:two-component response regulator ORR41-like [Herrania umbratica]XP_021300794.1 two-component response regulator ORR41-like [Herrania umbratica]XP_021300795.1 two-component response regulator ORR41-like [Herrania umbratica]XP_021300796.1 two-component response regulator ORR41-like [Herrania umbratica]XP_021300797.1 two-component response regulator ORR41-like [Herrania umbratica]
MAPAGVASGNPAAPRRANEGAPAEEEKGNEFPRVILRNRLTALVVDGSRFCRMVEQGLLQAYGLETQAVDNGMAAVELIASGANFNLIVIDMLLPVLNGLETTRQIRAMGVRCKMLGVTAHFYEGERQAFLAAGVDEFIEKPLTPDILAPILRELDSQ